MRLFKTRLRTLKNVLRLGLFVFLPAFLFAQEVKNPKVLIGDPSLARLQQGRKELTGEEKKDLERTVFTGLELMTYVHVHRRPGKDAEYFRWVRATDIGGIIQTTMHSVREKHYFKSHRALLTEDGIKPGDIEFRRMGFYFLPLVNKGDTYLQAALYKSRTDYRPSLGHFRPFSLRRVRSVITPDKPTTYYGALETHDDFYAREPWEEEHRILGEDSCGDKSCFVVESKNWFVKNPYYSRRVTWVEKESFLDLHEEQFDPQGRLFRVMDKEWELHGSGYWVNKLWIVLDVASGQKSVEEKTEWAFDQGFSDADISLRMLDKEEPWRRPKVFLPAIEKASALPPDPQVRWDFWKKRGETLRLAGKG
jgi:hypothetical protein